MSEAVTQDVQVLNSERIVGYNTFNSMADKSKLDIDDADYYNVTVNMVVKRKSKYATEQDQKKSAPAQA